MGCGAAPFTNGHRQGVRRGAAAEVQRGHIEWAVVAGKRGDLLPGAVIREDGQLAIA